jgi:type II secretory pathway component GspD/PulD (secretin)
VLGISKARSQRAPMGMAGVNPQQQQLLQILEQQMAVSLPGQEGGTKIESVEIVPNRITNSLLVSAPPEVMEIIAKVIGDLEQLEGRDVLVISHYELVEARVEDVLPLLQEVFSVSGGQRGAAGARGRSPAELGPVSISGDPRTNTLIIAAQAKDLPVVEDQIKLLDVEGPIAEAEPTWCAMATHRASPTQ